MLQCQYTMENCADWDIADISNGLWLLFHLLPPKLSIQASTRLSFHNYYDDQPPISWCIYSHVVPYTSWGLAIFRDSTEVELTEKRFRDSLVWEIGVAISLEDKVDGGWDEDSLCSGGWSRPWWRSKHRCFLIPSDLGYKKLMLWGFVHLLVQTDLRHVQKVHVFFIHLILVMCENQFCVCLNIGIAAIHQVQLISANPESPMLFGMSIAGSGKEHVCKIVTDGSAYY